KRMKGKGIPPLEACAIRFLNQGIRGFETEYHMSVANAEDEFETSGLGNQFPEIRKSLGESLQKRADDCHAALPEPPGFWDYAGAVVVGGVLGGGVGAVAGVGYLLWDSKTDSDKVFKALTDKLPFPGTRVVSDVYDGAGQFKYKTAEEIKLSKNYGNLEKHIRERLSNPEKDKALGLFSTDAATRADSKNWIIKDSTSIFGASKDAREAAAGSLSGDERKALQDSGELNATKKLLEKELGKLDFKLNEAYLDGNEGKALSMRVEKKLRDAQEKGNADIVTITGDLENMARQEINGTYGNAFVPPSHTEGLLNDMFKEHAKAFSGEAGQKADLTNEQARQLFTQHAQDMLWKYDQAYGGAKPAHQMGAAYGTVGWDKEHPEQAARYKQEERPTVTAAKSAIEAQVMAAGSKDKDKQDAAFAARGAYEILEGERVGSGETTQTRINALEDREWNQMKFAYEHASPSDQAGMRKSFLEAKGRHENRMKLLAAKLPDKKEIPKGGDPTDYVARRTGALLSGETAGAAYGDEMIRNGRASITTSVRMATEKWGTHEELINHALEGRSQQEQEDQRFKKETGESLHDRLYGTGGWFGGGELSGDDAQRAKEIQAGSAGTDRAQIEQTFLQFQHQAVEGTGFLSEGSMAGSPEKRNLYGAKDQYVRMVMAAAGRPNGDPAKVFGPNGKVLPPYTRAFDKNGKLVRPTDPLTGKPIGRMADLNRMRGSLMLASTSVKTGADAYKAAVDKQEAFWTRLITALAIVVSIALMFIPGVNLLVAGIIVAVLSGAATMAVKAGFRGGRYGWEEAATDVGMTAIECATAGIGGGLGKGAAAAEKAALRGGAIAAKEVAGPLAKAGAFLTNKLGKVGGTIAREAVVGAVGGAARTALNEQTWKEGILSGIGEIAVGGLKGAAVSAVSAGVSQGISNKISKSLGPALDPNKAGLGSRLGEKLGETGRH